MSLPVHESLSYSEGIMPDYGAKQGALSVSLPVLGLDSGWTGHTAVPVPSALDTWASSKTAGGGGCVFFLLIFVTLDCLFLFRSPICSCAIMKKAPSSPTFLLCDEG